MTSVENESLYPLVSVRIPAYNHEKYVQKTLDSVLEQNYPNIEIIIIDDASTDNTWNEIQAWLEKNKDLINVRAKRHEVNQGITNTLNELVDMCKGIYIAGIASDDYLLPHSIHKRVEYLEAHLNKGAVFSDCIVVNNDGLKLHSSGLSELYRIDKSKLLIEKSIAKELVLNWGVPGGSLMVRKDIHQVINFNEKLLIEDFDFFLKLLSMNALGFIDEKVSAYRLHDTNTSRVKSINKRLGNLKAFNATIQAHINNKSLKGLRSLGYKTEAKIAYLESKYMRVVLKLFMYGYRRFFFD